MTLIVAHVCPGAAVMAADSHAAEGDNTASKVDKIWTSGGLLLGYSGHLTVRDRLRDAIDAALTHAPLPSPIPPEMAASQLCAVARPILEEAYANFVGGPGDDAVETLGGALLAIGSDGDTYWLLEIDPNNTPSYYTADGFHTIGGASVAAHVSRRLLGHYGVPGGEVEHLRLLAFRTIKTCIDVLGGAYGIGLPIQLWQSTADGYESVEGEELSAVEEGVEQWVRIEQESLQKVFAVEETTAPEALPEQLDPATDTE